MGLVLRVQNTDTNPSGISIKGSALSYAQADSNFIYLLRNMSGSALTLTGNTTIIGNTTITGNLTVNQIFGTASQALNASTASFITASNVYGPFGSNSIISSSYAVTASYIDINLSDLGVVPLAVSVATTTALPRNPSYNNGSSGIGATLTATINGTLGLIDGVALTTGDRILVKDQSPQIQNGVYEITNTGSASTTYVLTRTTDSDETNEFDPQVVIPSAGTTNAGGIFSQTTLNPVLGTDNVIYVRQTTLIVTQAPAGSQTVYQIPWWTGNARELSKGSANFTYINDISGTTVTTSSLRLTGSLNVIPTANNNTHFIGGNTLLSGSVIVTGSTYLSGSTYLFNLATTPASNVLTYNSTTGQVFFTASTAIGGGGSTNPAPSDTFIQYNQAGLFGATGSFKFNYTSQSLEQGNSVIASGEYSHAQGLSARALGFASHAEGSQTTAVSFGSHAEGQQTTAIGIFSHTEGLQTETIGLWSHAEGQFTRAIGEYSHAEGSNSTSSGSYSHAEGGSTRALGSHSHTEGSSTTTIGNYSHAEGAGTQAIGDVSHAEGNAARSSGPYSHAEGLITLTIGQYSHAEGAYTTAIGDASHAEGTQTTALSDFSHTAGWGTVASGSYQSVIGQFNQSSSAQSAFIIGNGTNNIDRSNLVYAVGNEVQITGSLRVTGSAFVRGLSNTAQTNVLTYDSTTGQIFFTASTAVGSGIGSGVVTQIVAGSGISISPTSGTGSVTVTNTLSTSSFLMTGSLTTTQSLSGSLNITGSLNFFSGSTNTAKIENGWVILTYVSMSLNFQNDEAAAAGGVPLGGLYRNGNAISIRIS